MSDQSERATGGAGQSSTAQSPSRRTTRAAMGFVALAALALIGWFVWGQLERGGALGLPGPAIPTVAAPTTNIHELPPEALAGVNCAGCHTQPQTVASRADLRPTLKETCLECHQQQREQLGRPATHPPFQNGECTACHQVHPTTGGPSASPALLRASATELCLTCHLDKQQEQRLPFTHAPFANGQCTSCHDPHAGAVAPALRASTPELCFSCHQNTAQALRLPVQHPPFQMGSCGSCHSPHASEQPAQLRAPRQQVCLSCHAGPLARMDPAHKPVREGWCTDCHQPHGSSHGTLLKAEGVELCLMCHRK